VRVGNGVGHLVEVHGRAAQGGQVRPLTGREVPGLLEDNGQRLLFLFIPELVDEEVELLGGGLGSARV
jgi:hypothetical protein